MTNDQLNDIGAATLTDTPTEKALVAALLIDHSATGKVKDILTPQMFASRACGDIYAACIKADDSGNGVDLLTVTAQMRADGTLSAIGGPSALVEISQQAASAVHVQSWAFAVAELHNRRTLLGTLNQMSLSAMDTSVSVDGALYAIREALDNYARNTALGSPVPPVAEGVAQAYAALMDNVSRVREGRPLRGVPTGLRRLDRALGNLQPGSLYILAGRPAMGKTAMMLSMAQAAASGGHPAVIFSLEMTAAQIADRMLLAATDGQVLSEQYRRGTVDDGGLEAVHRAIDPLSRLDIYIDDCAATTMDYIRNKARKMVDERRCGIVMIDYLQLISTPEAPGRNTTREQEVGRMSRAAKLMAKDLGVPVVLLSQLNRAVETRADKRPVLADLRESGSIEQDADAVMFLHRAAYYGEPAPGVPANGGEVIVAKNRHGATCAVPFLHNESITKIWDYE